MESLKRHLNNNWNDYKRQELMDLFLGNFDTVRPYIYETKPEIAHKPNPKLDIQLHKGWWEDTYN